MPLRASSPCPHSGTAVALRQESVRCNMSFLCNSKLATNEEFSLDVPAGPSREQQPDLGVGSGGRSAPPTMLGAVGARLVQDLQSATAALGDSRRCLNCPATHAPHVLEFGPLARHQEVAATHALPPASMFLDRDPLPPGDAPTPSALAPSAAGPSRHSPQGRLSRPRQQHRPRPGSRRRQRRPPADRSRTQKTTART
jgi:hypothetical protein